MKSFIRPLVSLVAALVLACGLSACGGDHTGIEVKVIPPETTGFRFPDDYDRVRVQVEMDNSQTYGNIYSPPAVSKPPFVFLVLQGETEFRKAKSLSVDLLKGDVLLRRQVKSDVVIQQGELIQESFTFPGN